MSCNLKNSSDCYNSTNVTVINASNGNNTIVTKIVLPPKEKFVTCMTTTVIILCLQFVFVKVNSNPAVILTDISITRVPIEPSRSYTVISTSTFVSIRVSSSLTIKYRHILY